MPRFWTPGGTGWTLTFDEEFSGLTLNSSRWGVPNGTLDQTYTDYTNATFESSNIVIANSIANLSVNKISNGYTTASMTSTFTQTYGYWEARLKPPYAANGVAAGFWLDAVGWTFPEIDILEWLGIQPATNHMTWHYAIPNDGTNGIGVSFSLDNPQVNLNSDFHVYGMLWEPGKVTWFLDGLQIACTNYNVNTANAVPLQIIIDATVGGWGINKIDGSTQFPAIYQIDYIRVYSNSPTAIAATPDPGYST